MPFDRITIINVKPPVRGDLNTELQWLGAALGLFGDRDKDSSCFRVFVTLIRASQSGTPLSSDEIANQTVLSRGTVVHHLNRLRDAGLVSHSGEGYVLVGRSIASALETLQQDLYEALSLYSAVAKDIEGRIR